MNTDEPGNQSAGDSSAAPSLDSILDRLNSLGRSTTAANKVVEHPWQQGGEPGYAPEVSSFPLRDSIEPIHPEPIDFERIDVDFENSDSKDSDSRDRDSQDRESAHATIEADLVPPEIPAMKSPPVPERFAVEPQPRLQDGFSFGARPEPDVVPPAVPWESARDDASPLGAIVQLDAYRTPAVPGLESDADVSDPGAVPDVIDIADRLQEPTSVFDSLPLATPPPAPPSESSHPIEPEPEVPIQPTHIETWSLEADQSLSYADDAPAFVQPLEKAEIEGLRSTPDPVLSKTTRQPLITAVYVLIPIIVLIVGWWLATRT